MAQTRRGFLTSATSTVIVACSGTSHSTTAAKAGGEEEEITPVEDLMREHGVLRRVMYLYDDAIERLNAKREVPLDALGAAAGIVRRVIEDYHEKLEEELVFPRYEKAGKLADLTAVLRKQHQTGRTLTEEILALVKQSDHGKLAATLHRFNHMYRPHAAREDTVLFPALRELVGHKAYAELGEQFEDKEKEKLGDHGFERAVEDVARLEAAFGLGELAAL